MTAAAPPRAAQRTALAAWAPLVLGAVLALAALEWVRVKVILKADEAGMGTYTAAFFGQVDGRPIHCQDRRDTAKCVAAYHAAGSPPAVLWLGNSQVHGVNRYRKGQQTAPQWLHRLLAGEGRYLVAYTQPNANLLEHRLLLGQLGADYDIRTLILPVCLDDFRESGVRATTSGQAAEAFSAQPVVEAWLGEVLGGESALWRHRKALRGIIDYLTYLGRNRVLGIDAQTKRPVAPEVYAAKMAVLKGLLADARSHGIEVLLYIPPYRRDVEGPYVESDYRALQRDLAALADGREVRFADLTNVVPGPEWGMLREPLLGHEDYDFMHFTAEGHRRLALALEKAL